MNTMSTSTQSRISRLLLWLSALVAAIVALVLPPAWIAYSDRQAHRGPFLNFHPLFAILYVPLVFGLLWPILVRILAWAKQSAERPLVWPAKTAIVMFIVSASCSAPFIISEYRYYIRGVEAVQAEQMRMARFHEQQLIEKQKALAELQANGVASLSEPLTGPQVDAVNSYLDAHFQNPLELENASRHYPTSLPVMEHLAQKRDCPAQVLEIVYDNVVELQKDRHPQQSVNPSQVLCYLAWNPNVPVSVLVAMLDNPYTQVREAAAANPRLPEEAKVAYLKKAADSQSFSERERAAGDPDSAPEELSKMLQDGNFRVRQAAAANPNTPRLAKTAYFQKTALSEKLWDRILAAQSPDCPPELLKKLSLDPATAKYVASNPGAPTDLLQSLADSDDPETCRRAVASLTKRQKSEH